jgi:hypothetical protein
MTHHPEHPLRCVCAELDLLADLARHLASAELFLDEVSRAIDIKTNPAAAHADLFLALHQLRTAADLLADAYVAARGISVDDLPPREGM